jgi:hypothetical protein
LYAKSVTPKLLVNRIVPEMVERGDIGLFWLLRSRIGDFPPCRIYGPPGMADHIQGMISGVHWDRIGKLGPCFRVYELHGDFLKVSGLLVGKKQKQIIGKKQVTDNVLAEHADIQHQGNHA